MTSSTGDRIEGGLHETKGPPTENAGLVTNDGGIETKGPAGKGEGKVQRTAGRLEQMFGK